MGPQEPGFQPQQRLLAPGRQVSGPYSDLPQDCLSAGGPKTQSPEKGCREALWLMKVDKQAIAVPARTCCRPCAAVGRPGSAERWFPRGPRTGWRELQEAVWVEPPLSCPGAHRSPQGFFLLSPSSVVVGLSDRAHSSPDVHSKSFLLRHFYLHFHLPTKQSLLHVRNMGNPLGFFTRDSTARGGLISKPCSTFGGYVRS